MNGNLIDIYVTEIGRHLSPKSRADIQTEIRSALQDMLDERSKGTGKPVDDEMRLAVLQEYGSPEKVAASYQGERYLIGPRLYPAFIKVIEIVLPILGVLALLGLGLSLARLGSADELSTVEDGVKAVINAITRAISEFFGAMISGLGGITLIFAALERFIPDLKTKQERWDAHSLLKISPPDLVKPAELIVEIFFNGLAILLFNFFPQMVGFTPSLNSVFESGSWQGVTFIPILSEAFLRYIPFLTAIWVLTIVLDGILIQRGRWETWSRWFMLGIKALGISLAIAMLAGPSLIALTADSPLSTGLQTRETAQILVTLLSQGVRLGLVLAILFGGLDMIRMLIRLFRGKSPVIMTDK